MRPAVLVLAACLVASQFSGAQSANFLVLTPFGSNSVRAVFSILCDGLLQRGHHVTFISSDEPYPKHDNLTHLTSPHTALDQLDLFKVRFGLSVFKVWKKAFPEAARRMYESPEVMALWKRRHEFDAIIINSAANEMAFPFLMNRTVPFITLQPAGIDPLQLSYLGNVVSPAAVPSIVLPYDEEMNLLERTVNTLTLLLLRYSFHRSVGMPLAEALQPFFPDLPNPRSQYPLQDLSLFNSHPLIDGVVPLLVSQVEVGCLSCRPGAIIQDKEVRDFMEAAADESEGVVLFTLGSFQRPSRIPPGYVSTLLATFTRLSQYRFVAMLALPPAGSVTDQGTVPPNLLTRTWLPQQDILAHPATLLFISHCGRQSVSQAAYHGVPVLGLPIAFDQPRLCRRLQKKGGAVVLEWEHLTEDELVDTIQHMLHSTNYTQNMKKMSQGMTSEVPGLDKAMHHIERVLQHLPPRYSAQHLSLYQYLLLDVMVVLGAALGTVGLLGRVVVTVVWRMCGGGRRGGARNGGEAEVEVCELCKAKRKIE